MKSTIRYLQNRIINFFTIYFKRLYKTNSDVDLFYAAHKIITPFTGFVLADYYFSREIEYNRLGWLNPTASRINRRKAASLKDRSIIYCQADQLTTFAEKYLDLIQVPFILITGKWHLPGINSETLAKKVFESRYLIKWFSQNQIFAHLPIHPFPYGVQIQNAKAFLETSAESERISQPLIPFCTIHDHIPECYRTFREDLKSRMDDSKPFHVYKRDLQTHEYVVCPPGDRPDTYRHWETLASGAMPIVVNHACFKELFQESALYVEDFSEQSIIGAILNKGELKINADLVSVAYWKNVIDSKFK